MIYYYLIPKLVNPEVDKASGGTISNLRLIERLAENDQIIIIPMLFVSMPASFEKKSNIHVYLPKFNGYNRLKFFFQRYLCYTNRAKGIIRSLGEGRLLATRATIPVGLKLAQDLGYPLDLITRAFEDHEQSGLRSPSDRNSFFRKFDGFLNRSKIIKAYKTADRIITNSQYMVQETRKLFQTQSDFLVVYPEIDLPHREHSKGPIKRVGFVNKGARKGKHIVAELAIQIPDLRFLVFGEQMAEADQIANLTNCGYIHDRIQLFDSADLFIMPSLWDEPYGRVAAEAISQGKPVLVSKRGGLVESAPNPFFWVDATELNILEWKYKINYFAQNLNVVEEAVKNAQRKILQRKI